MARPTKAQRVTIVQRRAAAVTMRQQGADWQTIADKLGYKTRGAACQDVNRALEQAVAEQATSVEALRQQELNRLDELWADAYAILKRRHLTVNQGRVILDPDTGEKLRDDAPRLQAIDRLLKIQERRAKYLGLDAPTKVEAITIDAIDAEIARLVAELDGAEAGEAEGAEAPSS